MIEIILWGLTTLINQFMFRATVKVNNHVWAVGGRKMYQQRWVRRANKGGRKPAAKTWSAYISDPPHYQYTTCILAGLLEDNKQELVRIISTYLISVLTIVKNLLSCFRGFEKKKKLDLSWSLMALCTSFQQLKAQWVQREGERGVHLKIRSWGLLPAGRMTLYQSTKVP